MRRSVAALMLVLGGLISGGCSGSGSVPNPLRTGEAGSPAPNPSPTTAANTARPPAPAPAGRNELLGQPFSIRVGETVGIAGEDLVVTYSQLLSDNRCPQGVQCIVAGNARITVIAGTDSNAPVRLELNTDDGPSSARYLTYTVELVSLGRGAQPTATLRVT